MMGVVLFRKVVRQLISGLLRNLRLMVEIGIVISMLGKFYLTVSSVLSKVVIFIGSKPWQVSTNQLLSCISPLLFF